MQKGPLWWAGHHVNHHRFADRDGDPHSPMVSGVYYAHIGWFLNDTKHDRVEATNPVIRDFSKVPEIALARALLLRAAAAAGDRDVPRRRHAVAGLGLLPADDDAGARDVRDQHRQPHVRVAPVRHASTSRATTSFTAFFAAGEGWHNNHHRYQRAARNGFYWWEFDHLVRDPGDGGGRPGLGHSAGAEAHLRGSARREGPPRRADVPSIVESRCRWNSRKRQTERAQEA